jgi:hypothetical protein
VKRCCSSSLGIFSPNFGAAAKCLVLLSAIFAKQKARNAERKTGRRLTKPIKEQSMEYLILIAVISVMALYAAIIVGCLKQPEW